MWREQYDRMRRWYARLSEPATDEDRHLDDFHAFFIVCFHLKDWLKEDPSVDCNVRDEVEGFLSSNLWLRLCADLANSSKHLTVDRTPRYDSQARIEKRASLVVSVAGDAWPALDIAKKFVAAWDTFLTQRGLLPES